MGDKFGEGKYYSKENKLIYEGSFAFGKYNGLGKEIINEKENLYYEGNYENDKCMERENYFLEII